MQDSKDFKTLLQEKLLYYFPHFSADVLNAGLEKFQLKSLKAGDHLFRTGEVADKMFLTEKSISRNYLIQEEKEKEKP